MALTCVLVNLGEPILIIRCLFFYKATVLHSSYLELLTRSGDYQRFLGDMLKSMEELKVRLTHAPDVMHWFLFQGFEQK